MIKGQEEFAKKYQQNYNTKLNRYGPMNLEAPYKRKKIQFI